MKYKKLGNTDINAPVLSFGASVFNNFFKDASFDNSAASNQKLKQIIRKALDEGINYFDVAPWYGNAQQRLAIGLEGIERSTYYLATKVGRYNSDKSAEHWFDFSYKRTVQSVEESLKLFKTDYLDLVQVHDFEFAQNLQQDVVDETLRALDDLRKEGKVKYIGVNSYIIEKLRELLEMSPYKIDTILTFAHLTLDDTSLLEHVDYFKQKKVGIINASPLSMGLYTRAGPPNWHRVHEEVKAAVRAAFDYCDSQNVDLIKLALYFSAANDYVDTTLVSMASEEIIEKNLEAIGDLSEHESTVLNIIREKLFKPLNYKGFGYEEVDAYREKMLKREM